MQKYLYHSTFMQNLKSIFRYGLNPQKIQKKNYAISKDNVIYLSDNIDNSQIYCKIKQYSKNESPNNIITLTIDTSKLDVQLFEQDTTYHDETGWRYHHYMYNGIIPIDAIVDIKTYFHNNKINQNIIKQAKQVGILYHYTTIYKLFQILKSNKLQSHKWKYRGSQWSQYKYNNSPETKQVVCFTRNKNFHNSADLGTILTTRLVIDGNKLSNNYKIKPMRDVTHLGHVKQISDESQQSCFRDIENLKEYVIRVDIDYHGSLFAIYNKYMRTRPFTFKINYKLCKYLLMRVVRRLERNQIPYQYVKFIKDSATFDRQLMSYRNFLETTQNL